MAAKGAVVLSVDSADVGLGPPHGSARAAVAEDLRRRRSTVARVRAAVAALRVRRDVDPRRIAFVGFSRRRGRRRARRRENRGPGRGGLHLGRGRSCHLARRTGSAPRLRTRGGRAAGGGGRPGAGAAPGAAATAARPARHPRRGRPAGRAAQISPRRCPTPSGSRFARAGTPSTCPSCTSASNGSTACSTSRGHRCEAPRSHPSGRSLGAHAEDRLLHRLDGAVAQRHLDGRAPLDGVADQVRDGAADAVGLAGAGGMGRPWRRRVQRRSRPAQAAKAETGGGPGRGEEDAGGGGCGDAVVAEDEDGRGGSDARPIGSWPRVTTAIRTAIASKRRRRRRRR